MSIAGFVRHSSWWSTWRPSEAAQAGRERPWACLERDRIAALCRAAGTVRNGDHFMEMTQIRQQVADLRDRADALRGYL